MTSVSDRLVDCGGGEPVRRPPLGLGRFGDHAGREERMAEPDLPVRELEHVRGHRGSEGLGRDPGRLDLRQRRRAHHRHDEQRVPRLLGECAQPLADEVVERLGHGKRLGGVDGSSHGLERTGELQGIERVAARHLVQPEHRRPRERSPQPIANEAVDRAQAERADAQPADLRGKRTLELGRVIAPPGQENLNRLTLEPPQRERERIRRGHVQPLTVVDRDHDRLALRKRPQHVVHRHSERTRIGARLLAALQQERGLERLLPRSRELGKHLGSALAQQVAECGVRKPLLGLRRPGREHPQRTLTRGLETPASQSVDLPIPASPSSTIEPVPSPARSKKACKAATSSSLPTISTATARPC